MLSGRPDPAQGSPHPRFEVYSPRPKAIRKSDLLYRAIFAASFVGWLVMTGLLFHQEILPRWRVQPGKRGYEALLGGVREARFTRMAILSLDRESEDLDRVGTAESEIWPLPDGGWRLVSRTKLQDKGDFESESIVGPDYQLREVHVRAKTPLGDATMDGVVDGKILHMSLRLGELAALEQDFAASDEIFQFDSYSPFDIPADLVVGRTWQTVQFNPFAAEKTTIYDAEVLRLEENFYWEGERKRVYVIVFTERDRARQVSCYVTPEGEVLEQHMPAPFNYVLRLEKISRDPDR